jgi:hypothetical protein
MSDLHLILDSTIGAFIAIAFTETLIKPIALRVGRWFLLKLNNKVKFIPDWITGGKSD